MTPSRKAALEDMPDIVGTPDTSAYQRSSEHLLRWYDAYYKTIRQALSTPEMEDRSQPPYLFTIIQPGTYETWMDKNGKRYVDRVPTRDGE